MVSINWQQKKLVMNACLICEKNEGLSTSSLKLHMQKSHKRISSGSVDSLMTVEIKKALEELQIGRASNHAIQINIEYNKCMGAKPNNNLFVLFDAFSLSYSMILIMYICLKNVVLNDTSAMTDCLATQLTEA
ncbi:Dual specificity protein phosphatase PHS1 [Platanthera guangdongensis]|uniref:Dual specificity protein phosphatase PHS1 n=1 Tax=Platanthera guangdongensis TaxID=2320717 RepID=A0ABR2LWM8_9ASPA